MSRRLDLNILLVDRGFTPLRAISRRRAIGLEWLQKAYFVTPDIMQLNKFMQRQVFCNRYKKWYVYARDKSVCQYCGGKLVKSQRTIDHVIPIKHGGRSSYENCVTACRICNTVKGHKLPHEIGFSLLNKPSVPKIIDVLRYQHSVLFSKLDNYLSQSIYQEI